MRCTVRRKEAGLGHSSFPLIFRGSRGTSVAMSEKNAVLAANAAFYQAFGNSDLAAMGAIWADEVVSCIHPGWPVLIGRQSVLESYHKILSNPSQERIEHRNDMVLVSENDGRVFCVEIVGGMALAATNWFKRIDGTWRLVHHQASPLATLAQEPDLPPAKRLN
jgi:ketosteroid isomerase-like protein